MRLLLLLPILYVAAVLETSLPDAIAVGRVAPDFLALLAAVWVLVTPGRRTFLTAGVIGLAADLLAPGRVGLGMACFLVVGYALTRLREKFRLDHVVWQVLTVCVAVTVLEAGLATGRWLLGETPVARSTLFARAVGVGIYTTGVSLPLLMILGWVREPFRTRRTKLAGF